METCLEKVITGIVAVGKLDEFTKLSWNHERLEWMKNNEELFENLLQSVDSNGATSDRSEKSEETAREYRLQGDVWTV